MHKGYRCYCIIAIVVWRQCWFRKRWNTGRWKLGTLSRRRITHKGGCSGPACPWSLSSASLVGQCQWQAAELDKPLILQCHSWSCSLVLNRRLSAVLCTSLHLKQQGSDPLRWVLGIICLSPVIRLPFGAWNSKRISSEKSGIYFLLSKLDDLQNKGYMDVSFSAGCAKSRTCAAPTYLCLHLWLLFN